MPYKIWLSEFPEVGVISNMTSCCEVIPFGLLRSLGRLSFDTHVGQTQPMQMLHTNVAQIPRKSHSFELEFRIFFDTFYMNMLLKGLLFHHFYAVTFDS